MKKKQALQPNLPKLKLDKERIMALTESASRMIVGGYGQIAKPVQSAVDEMCGGTKSKQ